MINCDDAATGHVMFLNTIDLMSGHKMGCDDYSCIINETKIIIIELIIR